MVRIQRLSAQDIEVASSAALKVIFDTLIDRIEGDAEVANGQHTILRESLRLLEDMEWVDHLRAERRGTPDLLGPADG